MITSCIVVFYIHYVIITIGNLHMTIPWSNLYSDPVIIEVDGLYAVIQPESGLL